MSAVSNSRKTASSVSGQPRVIRTSEGIRTKQASRAAPSSGQGAKPTLGGPALHKSGVTNGRPTKVSKKQQTDSLRAKEDEYRRMNAELEAKTSELVKEAEELLKGNLSILSDLDKSGSFSEGLVHTPAPIRGDDRGTEGSQTNQKKRTKDKPRTSSRQAPPTSRPTTSSANIKARPQRTVSNLIQPLHSSSGIHHQGMTRHSDSVEDDIDPFIRIDVDQTVQRLEKELDDVTITSPTRVRGVDATVSMGLDDILPGATENMGSEATIRFLKAKLRVMQEEMDRLCQECCDKDKHLSVSEAKLKELTEQNIKLQRNHKSVSSQVDKYKQSSETLKHKCDGLEAQLVSLRKEVDGMKTTQKKASGQHGALEVRLNRALEETEKYKSALQKARIDLKDASKQEHAKVEQLTATNKMLTKQKTELIAAFKKQLELIDVLKKQKMHIEAAKMLSFTEEEFVKALDWGAS